MKVELNGEVLTLTEVYSGLILETSEGNQISVCMRDDTFEINICPKGADKRNWWRVDMQEGTVVDMKTLVSPETDEDGRTCN